jgi:hypothetical protein
MFSRKAYEKTGIINEALNMCLDYEYWIRLAQNYEFGFINEFIGATRMYEGTKTSMMQQQHLLEAINILMKYYGKVPMKWIVSKILADHVDGIMRYIPRGILIILLLPFRNKVIKDCLKGRKDDQSVT